MTCTCGTVNTDNPVKGLLAGAVHRFDGKPCYLDISAPNALERIEAMIDAELERVRKTDDLWPARWWMWRRKEWIDGVQTARAISERNLWAIKSAFYEDPPWNGSYR